MIVGVLDTHRQEGSGADVQCHAVIRDARIADGVQQSLGEVQRRRRRGHGAVVFGEHGLVVVAVGVVARGIALDVGRQRHDAVTLQHIDQVASRDVEAEPAFAHVALADAVRCETRREDDVIARIEFLRRLGEDAPGIGVDRLVQGYFHLGAAVRPAAVGGIAALACQPGRNDAGVVEHHDVAGPEQVRQVPDTEIVEPVRCRNVQHPRTVARARRALRDTRLRQVKIEQRNIHERGFYRLAAKGTIVER